jgi:chemotaxis protein histidine kinase CheA
MGYFQEDFYKEIQDEFFSHFQHDLNLINSEIVKLERGEAEEGNLKEAYRLLHSIKGTAGSIGLPYISILAHKIEDIFSLFFEKNRETDPEAFLTMFRYLDAMEQLGQYYQKGSSREKIDHLLEKVIGEGSKKLQILIIESSKSIKKFLKNQLSREGYEIMTSPNPMQALLRILNEPVDVLITSLEHPGLDGLNLIKMIKAHEHKKYIKTILLSSTEVKDDAPDLVMRKEKSFHKQILDFVQEIHG